MSARFISTVLAFIAAGLVPEIILTFSFPLAPYSFKDRLYASALLFPIGAMVTAALGFPLFLLGKKLKFIRWWSASLAGGLVGVVFCFLGASQLSWFDRSPPLWGAVYMGVMGVCSGFVFWLVWRTGRLV
jgi:hypothetical protein